MVKHKLVWLVLLLITAIAIFQSSTIIYNGFTETEITAKATEGTFSICLNHPPELVYTCNTTLIEDQLYECQLNINDSDVGDDFFYNNTNISTSLVFSINESGYLSGIPRNEDVGSNTVRFQITDDSGCENNYSLQDVEFTVINTNDAPIFLPPMGPFSWDEPDTLRGIYLDAYFEDPDGDNLNYTHSTVPSGFLLTVTGDNELIFSHTDCGSGSMIFTAEDPYGLEVDSDLVQLYVNCADRPSPTGGGGGFGDSCTPDWVCKNWEDCLPNSSQRKNCVDKNACEDDYDIWVWRECVYIYHCNNNLRDYDEEGVDCGGECKPCETCDDLILNNGEEEIDCGGPNCKPCSNCFDGIQNYGELGIDCGGLCDPCPSCFDGIQNQNETGVDCGGPCRSCDTIESPSPLRTNTLGTLIVSLLGLGVLILIVYRIFRKHIHKLLAKLVWLLNKGHRKQILLNDKQKNDLLDDIHRLEKSNLLKSQKTHPEFQDKLETIYHKLFVFLIGGKYNNLEVVQSINQLKTTNIVKNILRKQYSQLVYLEKHELLPEEDLMLGLEFLRQRVFSLSKVTRKEIARPINPISPDSESAVKSIKQLLYNSVLALEFSNVAAAKRNYLDALGIYDTLSTSQQDKVFNQLRLVFDNISYVGSYS